VVISLLAAMLGVGGGSWLGQQGGARVLTTLFAEGMQKQRTES